MQMLQAKIDIPEETDYDLEPPRRRISDVYSELLGIHVDDLGDLIDVQPEELVGHSGNMLYGYLLDFEELATPEQAEIILRLHGSLRVEVVPSFFDGAVNDDWPN
jgi:hypothetical protein